MPKKVIKKRYKGKPEIVNKGGVKRSYAKKNNHNYSDEDVNCKGCNNGKLRRMQWNRLLCTNHKCHYSELI